MKKIYILAFLVITGNSFAQVTFQKTFGGIFDDQGFSIDQTSDSGYIIGGFTRNFGAVNYDWYLVRTDLNGNTLWTKTFGKNWNDRIKSVKQSSDVGYIICGLINGDTYLVKTDSSGNVLWSKNYGLFSPFGGTSVEETFDGGFVVTGANQNPGTVYDIPLIKTDSNGNALWIKDYGGISQDIATCVRQTADNGFIIVGSSADSVPVLISYDVFVVKTDSIGDTLWTKNYGGSDQDMGYSIELTTDGGYIIGGYTQSFGGTDVYLIKIDSIGNILWSKTYGGAYQNIPSERSIYVDQTNDGGYFVTAENGGGSKDIYLIKTDSIGTVIWARNFGGVDNDYSGGSKPTYDGGYIIAGSTNNFGSGGFDMFLIKTDSLGNGGCNQTNLTVNGNSVVTQNLIHGHSVVSVPIVNLPTDFSIGSGIIITTLCTTVGIADSPLERGKECVLSPNPATNNFTITFPHIIRTATVSIYNLLGETIFKENIANTSRKEITLTNINAGIYFVRVIADGEQYTQKLVVQ